VDCLTHMAHLHRTLESVAGLRPPDDVDTTHLIDAKVAMASLREDLTSNEVGSVQHV